MVHSASDGDKRRDKDRPEHGNKRRRRHVLASQSQGVAVVDAFSTGAVLAAMLAREGLRCVAVYSEQIDRLDSLRAMVPHDLSIAFDAVVHWSDPATMAEELRALPFRVVDVLAGAEPGVQLADELSERLGLRTNGTALSMARRNKYVMGEAVRAAGIRAASQLRASTWAEMSALLVAWPSPFRAVVKPLDSAGSDGISLCASKEEACAAFHRIIDKPNALGLHNSSALVQEYLDGPEYIVDMVSRDAAHKATAVWQYDKRAVNGAAFVYFGQTLLDVEDAHVTELVAYMKRVADALGIAHGPSHGEVKWCGGEPVLVEVGARCNGAEGAWMELADRVFGYNQVGVTVNAYRNPAAFALCPDLPSGRKGYAKIAYLVSYVEGAFVRVDPSYASELMALPSFVHMECCFEPGQRIRRTVDCFSWGGIVKLFHADDATLQRDYDRIREMELTGLFQVA